MYARVSLEETSDKKRMQDPENQLRPLRQFAESLGHEIVEEYVDRKSGADPNREQFRKMLQDAAMCRFKGILVWKMDRFSREGILQTLSYIRRLKERGIFIRSLTESWMDTTDSGMAELILSIASWASAEERKKISERTKAGIAQKRALGQWRGGRPRKKGPPETNGETTPR
ncbi:MAG: recombinase family protein [Candidatus Paceibacterota bacterium]